MEPRIEKEVTLGHVSVQLATVHWQKVEETPPYPAYYLSQRLSDNHAPLRIGNLSAPQVLPRVGSVGLLPPGRSVRMFPVEQPLRVIYCIFDAPYFESTTGIARELWVEQIDSLVAMRNRRLEILMQEIHAELDQPGFGQELLIEAASTMIVVELARYMRELRSRHATCGPGQPLAPWQLRRIEERIHASLELGYPNMSELAELCGISQSHLMRSFKASTGWQIHKFIAEERIKAAKAMLAQEQLSCREVSTRLGFGSPAYFSTAFRRMTGKSPREYQKLARARPAR